MAERHRLNGVLDPDFAAMQHSRVMTLAPLYPAPSGRLEFARCETDCRGMTCFLDVYGEVDVFESRELADAIAGAAHDHLGALVVSFARCGTLTHRV